MFVTMQLLGIMCNDMRIAFKGRIKCGLHARIKIKLRLRAMADKQKGDDILPFLLILLYYNYV